MRPVYFLALFIPTAVMLEDRRRAGHAIFFTAAAGVIPTAALMGRATEELATQSGPGIGGLLNVTFGNAPELIIALFALGKGLQEVVKASIVGSIVVEHAARAGRGDAVRRLEAREADLQPHRRACADRRCCCWRWSRW